MNIKANNIIMIGSMIALELQSLVDLQVQSIMDARRPAGGNVILILHH